MKEVIYNFNNYEKYSKELILIKKRLKSIHKFYRDSQKSLKLKKEFIIKMKNITNNEFIFQQSNSELETIKSWIKSARIDFHKEVIKYKNIINLIKECKNLTEDEYLSYYKVKFRYNKSKFKDI